MQKTFSTYQIKVNNRHKFQLDPKQLNGLDLRRIGKKHYSLLYNGKSYHIEVLDIKANEHQLSININGKKHDIHAESPLMQKINALGISQDTAALGEQLQAPMPGKVLEVLVSEGDEVTENQDILILEAMKMENVLKSSIAGTVKNISVSADDNVNKNALLLEIEPLV